MWFGVSIFVSGQLAKLVKGFTDSEPMIGGIRHVPAKYCPITILMSEIPHQGLPPVAHFNSSARYPGSWRSFTPHLNTKFPLLLLLLYRIIGLTHDHFLATKGHHD